MNLSYHFLANIGLKDILDIFLVAILFYYIFLLIRGTRAVQIAIGVGVVLILLAISYAFKLETTYWILHFVPIGLAVLLPIVFQPELRRALSRLGSEALMRGGIYRLGREKVVQVVDELLWTLSFLSQGKIGALIALERDMGLEEFIKSGTRIEAEVSSKLLISIFNPKSPLHDGAVIIRGTQILAAACYLPLSEELAMEQYGKKLGTRHRAALELSQQTDAVIMVVSEETGAISLAYNGALSRNFPKEDELKQLLIKLLVPPVAKPGFNHNQGKVNNAGSN